MPIDVAPANDHGFLNGKFKDRYDVPCSIQKSSLAFEDCIWLGADEVTVDHVTGKTFNTRMHLTQDMVRDLLPLLHRFADTGELS